MYSVRSVVNDYEKCKRFSAMDYDMKRLIYIEPVVLVSLLLVFAAAAYQRNLIWKDDLSLWSDVVKKSPTKVLSSKDEWNLMLKGTKTKTKGHR